MCNIHPSLTSLLSLKVVWHWYRRNMSSPALSRTLFPCVDNLKSDESVAEAGAGSVICVQVMRQCLRLYSRNAQQEQAAPLLSRAPCKPLLQPRAPFSSWLYGALCCAVSLLDACAAGAENFR